MSVVRGTSPIRKPTSPFRGERRSNRRRRFRGAGERLESRELLTADVIISEFMAANSSGLEDADGDRSDWIELHNTSEAAVNLGGWSLSDDNDRPRRWTFPDLTLPPGDFLVVFASSKDRREPGGELHTNFALSRDGEYLGLMRVDGTIADEYSPRFSAQLTDHSFGVGTIDGRPVRGFMTDATPGTANAQVYAGIMREVEYSHPGGIQVEPLVVEIHTEPGAVVRFTTDGSLPTETEGTLYTAPLTIDTTTVLRAAAFQPGYLPSPLSTRTFLFLEDVVRQTQRANFPPLPAGDYDMDPDVAQSVQYAERLREGLVDLPSLSLVLPVDDFVGPRGIYSNPQGRGRAWERAVSVEWFGTDNEAGFQVNAGLRIQGGASRDPNTTPKHSFSVRFRDDYGTSALEYPLFPGSPVTTFTSLSLRGGSNNTWLSGNSVDRSRAQYQRDQWVRDTMLDMGHADAGRGRYVHLYINGLYWGLYNLTERVTASHYAQYFGGDADDYDAWNGGQVVDGTREALDRMRSVVATGQWDAIESILDVDQYIDYQIINRYGSNSDLDASRNYRLAGGGPGDARWRVYPWDSEEVLYSEGSTGVPPDPVGVRNDLEKLLEYRIRFADRLYQHLFHGGALTPENAAARWMRRAAELDRAIIGESARWGDHRRDARPYGRDAEWITEQTRLLTAYFPARSAVLLDLYRSDGLYPAIDPPALSHRRGLVPRGQPIELDAQEGTILYTLDGSDPRLPGGEVNPAAREYTSPFTLAADARLRARTRLGDQWSALASADLMLQSELTLIVSEIQAAPHPANLVAGQAELDVAASDFEFIELTNVGTQAIDLQGVRLVEPQANGQNERVLFEFRAQTLEPGEQLVVPRNRQAFLSRYGDTIRLAEGGAAPASSSGQLAAELDDRGQRISLIDAHDAVIDLFDYSAAIGDSARAAGHGSSLELNSLEGQRGLSHVWQPSRTFSGSPGKFDSNAPRDVVMSELFGGDGDGSLGWIAFHNLSDEAVEMQGWYLGGPDDPLGARIESPLSLPSHSERVIDLAQLDLPWNAQAAGEIWLIRVDEHGIPVEFADHARYAAHTPGVTIGRPADDLQAFVPLSYASPGRANPTALVEDLVISEIQFDPVDYDGAEGLTADTFEYVEIFNRSDQEIDLEGWRLVGDVHMTFDRGTRIAAGGTLLAVSFLPTRGTQANPFRQAYGINPGTAMEGPYLGHLPNERGSVQLQRPLAAVDAAGPPIVYVEVDRVDYDSQPPWPQLPHDEGHTLQRIASGIYGNRPSTWQAEPPNPGATSLTIRASGDANDDGRFDTRDLVQVMQQGKFARAVAATFAEGDWNRDGRFDMDDLLQALARGGYEASVDELSPPAAATSNVQEPI